MKVARIYINFLLPDDFNGDFNDVLKEIIKYRKSKKLTNPQKDVLTKYTKKEIKTLQSAHNIYWKNFIKQVINSGGKYRIHGGVSISKLLSDGTWEKIRK